MTRPKGSPIDIEKEIDRLSVVFGKETRMEIAQWARSIAERVEVATIKRCANVNFQDGTNGVNGRVLSTPRLYSPSSSEEK